MPAGERTQGHRRPDQLLGDLPSNLKPGDYWKYVLESGMALSAGEDGNLTDTVWGFMAPNGGIGTLTKHTVRENDDGTITIKPKDGSSNSILITQGIDGPRWHGYVYDGVWESLE